MKLLQNNVLGRNKLNYFEATQVLGGLAQILIWGSEIAKGGTWSFGIKGGTYESQSCHIYIYTWVCNVSWIYKHINKFHFSTNLPTSPFLGEKCTMFLKNKQNSNSHSFCKVGEIQLWLIKTTCFTYLILILIQQYKIRLITAQCVTCSTKLG